MPRTEETSLRRPPGGIAALMVLPTLSANSAALAEAGVVAEDQEVWNRNGEYDIVQ